MAEAIRELDWVVERGAKIILIRPAPVPSLKGFRSFALPEFDPFWAKVQEYDITVGMHASDDGLTRYFNQWEGHHDEHLPFANTTAFGDVQHLHEPWHLRRHGFGGLPRHAVPVPRPARPPGRERLELGAPAHRRAWGTPTPSSRRLYEEDPVTVLRRNVWIHPFFEEDPLGLIKAIGTDRVVFGSDYPHPEGLADPVSYAKELDSLPDEDITKIMGGNLAEALNVALSTSPPLGAAIWHRERITSAAPSTLRHRDWRI